MTKLKSMCMSWMSFRWHSAAIRVLQFFNFISYDHYLSYGQLYVLYNKTYNVNVVHTHYEEEIFGNEFCNLYVKNYICTCLLKLF